MKVARVVVVGQGHAPAMAAIALRRAFAPVGVEVTWVETPGEAPADAVLAGLPNLLAFHQLLGLDPAAVLRETQGCFTMGRHYVGFAGEGRDYLHGFGPVGRPIAGLPFLPFWLKARAEGLPAGFGDFAREAVAARNGRIRIAGDGETTQGLHLDARGYAALLRRQALAIGVTIRPDTAPRALVAGGAVRRIGLSDGSWVDADLVVDASEDAAILSALGTGDPVDASLSGVGRMLVGSARPLRPLPLYSHVAAHRAGWTALHPLRDRTGVAVAYDPALMSDEAAMAQLPVPLVRDPVFVPLTPRERRKPWIGNVVAIGAAAARPDPLAALDLHRLQVALTHLISLFPVRADAMPEAGIYNDELAGWSARMRDFAAVPHALNGRQGEPFWDAARARPISSDLEARIALFAARGMVAAYHQDSFAEDEWETCLLGLGVMPESWDPQVDRVDEQQVMADFRDQLAAIRADVLAMDSHEAALHRAMA
ncbi:tryptophan 7-halogenase [Sphingomonas sp. HF-S3]|uniref:Tryptophan 7-halogenase n=1 Tax=Sphingomonas rustica TaxID=3103142 RepID=A0ABV0B443_9SPHN